MKINGLEVSAGRTCTDPRVRTLDLSGGRDFFDLILEDSSRRPLSEGLALAWPTRMRVYRGQCGVLRLPARLQGRTLFLWAPHFKVVRLEFPRKNQRVRMERGILLRIALDPALPPPRPPLEMQVHLSLEPGKTDTDLAAALFLGLSGLHPRALSGRGPAWEFLLPCPGAYTLSWGVAWKEGFLTRTLRPARGFRYIQIHVPDGGLPSTLTLHPDREAYLSLLKRARRAYTSGHER